MQAIHSYRLLLSFTVLAALLSGLWPTYTGAVSIVECQGPDGKRFFSDRCPPGSTSLNERKIRTSGGEQFDADRLQQESPVVLYLVDACDSCDLMQNYLDKRGVPYTSKDVSAENPDNQDELKEKAGRLTVPVVTIGEEVISGYNRAALGSALDTAGYPEATAAPEASEQKE